MRFNKKKIRLLVNYYGNSGRVLLVWAQMALLARESIHGHNGPQIASANLIRKFKLHLKVYII